MEWVDPLLRGCFGLVASGVLMVAARLRYKERGTPDGPRDIGLD